MRLLLSVLLTLVATLLPLNARTVRILAIGNSFAEDALLQHMHQLVESDGDTVIIGIASIGGCELQKHAYNARHDAPIYRYYKIDADNVTTTTNDTPLTKAIADERWDIVTLQQASHYSGIADSYQPWLDQLIAYVRQNVSGNPEIAFHQTWAYSSDAKHWAFSYYGKDQLTMYNHINEAARTAMSSVGIDTVLPSGTAIQNARTSHLGDKMNRDGYHLDMKIGRYIAACTWYETIFQKDVRDNTYCPDGVDANDAATARAAAHAAVQSPWTITPIE